MTRPRWHNDHALLAAVARELHRRCRERCHTAIETGTMTRDDANDAVRVRRAIATAWLGLAMIRPEPAGNGDPVEGGAWPYERRAALADDLASARADARDAPTDAEVTGFADAVATLLWWEDQRPSARFLVDTTIALRAQAVRQLRAASLIPSQPSMGKAA